MDGWICLRMLLKIASQNNPEGTRYTSSLLSSQVLAEQTGLAKVFTLTFILIVHLCSQIAPFLYIKNTHSFTLLGTVHRCKMHGIVSRDLIFFL